MPGTEDESESDDAKPAPTTTSTAWPKRPGERIAAIRDLVLGSKRVWRTEEVASNFKGAKKKDVEDFLDNLAGIGVLVAYGEAGKDFALGPTGDAVGVRLWTSVLTSERKFQRSCASDCVHLSTCLAPGCTGPYLHW